MTDWYPLVGMRWSDGVRNRNDIKTMCSSHAAYQAYIRTFHNLPTPDRLPTSHTPSFNVIDR